MRALPRAFLSTRNARLSTCLIAMAMILATIFTFHGTWRAGAGAVRFTDMRTNQHPFTSRRASLMYSAHSTLATRSGAPVTTFQNGLTKD